MSNPPDFHNAGRALVAAAISAPQSPGDIVRKMFPYIWQASRTLSTRKISDWLKAEQNISLSQATVSRALRNAPMYWAELADKIEPSARVVAEYTASDPLRFLFDEEWFDQLFLDSHSSTLSPSDLAYDEIEARREALQFLRAHWFTHPQEVRANCRRYLDTDDKDELEERERLAAQEFQETNF